ncbi:hypothetical protein B0H16DRAFT_1455230 [Mycena metata]|uniref:Mixed lineage kinase domain-containing protein n=1 Tax=Mycena metata TaxID=1033252 RepID=A0AAD7JES0_9AGAR|nr:hypothetical protein B0H16DRAFT_1455230 [Mycena metata]
MPPVPSLTANRLSSTALYLAATIDTVEILSHALRTPFLGAITTTTRSLLKGVETIKHNEDECNHLLQRVQEVLRTIIHIHLESETEGELPPSVLNHLGEFTETIHKIHTFLESQQGSSRLRRFFRQAELSTLLKDCKSGLQWAHDAFKNVEQMRKTEEMMHQEVLNMIENLSDGTASDGASTGSFPRIAVLGAGGMGKTSLARAVVHDAQIISMFGPNRHFVLGESCTTEVELAALIGAHIRMKPGKDLTRQVLQHFPLDLHAFWFWTIWKPTLKGKQITMRGVERPGKVHWTHPFLHPLKPLDYTAARQAFIDIADDTHDPKELDKVLSLTDHMPLAMNLLAHLVDSEGCFHVLTRWAKEKTSIISAGYDRGTNLNLSISLSLSSPRLNLLPQSKDLLSLLSLLPDGLSDTELVQSGLPINKILACKTALLGTSLAYSDEYKKLKVLMPIREYMQRTRPPGDHLIQSLLFHYKAVLELHGEYRGTQSDSKTTFPNMESLILDVHFDQLQSSKIKGEFYLALAEYHQFHKNDSEMALSLCQNRHIFGNINSKHPDPCSRASADLFAEARVLRIEAMCCAELGSYTQSLSYCNRARDLLKLCGLSGGDLDFFI